MCATVLQAVERPLTADCRVAVYFSSLNGDPPFIVAKDRRHERRDTDRRRFL
jgi:hypothetical protein